MEWISPHSRIHLDVTGEDGSVVKWMVECGSTNALLRNGLIPKRVPVPGRWPETQFVYGMDIVIDGYQAKDGTLRVNGRDITVADGKKLFLWRAGLYASNSEASDKIAKSAAANRD
jgi:hypothetical protein